MTTDDFRRIALAMPGAEERNGLGYPNFRAERKSFATIENAVALIRLTRDQQATFMATAPGIFTPAPDAWGRWGSTIVRLEAADEATLRDALATAWRNITGVSIDPFKIADAGNVTDPVGDANTADLDATTDSDAADVSDAAADVAHVVAADVANDPGVNLADVRDTDFADVDNVAHVDAANIPDAGNRAEVGGGAANDPDGSTDVAKVAAGNVGDGNIETPDELQNAIDRLQVYWGQRPAR
jgi:hypothetical protein